MARRRSRSVRRRKQRGGDGGFFGAIGSLFGKKSSLVTADTKQIQPPSQPLTVEPPPKTYTITANAISFIKFYNDKYNNNLNVNIIPDSTCTEIVNSGGKINLTFAKDFEDYKLYKLTDGSEIMIPEILIGDSVIRNPQAGGRRSRKNRSRRSTRKQRR